MSEIPPFDQELWNRIPWVRVDDRLALPDLGKILLDYLDDDTGTDEQLDAKVIGEQIVRQLEENKNTQRTGTESFRLSASGSCLRRMAYDYHGIEHNGFKGDGSSRIVFAVGDAVEAMVTLALRDALKRLPVAALTNILDEQETVYVQVQAGSNPWDSFRVPGHPDGRMLMFRWVNGETPEEAWEASWRKPLEVVLELKSASDFGFDKFREKGARPYEESGLPDGYFFQTQAYQLAARQAGRDVAWSYMLMFGKGASAKDAWIHPSFDPPKVKTGKNAGKPRSTFKVYNQEMWGKQQPIVGAYIPRHDQVQAEIVDRYVRVVNSSGPDDFERVAHKSGKIKFPCDWCPHLRNCFPEAREVAERLGWFTKATKIRTIVEEK